MPSTGTQVIRQVEPRPADPLGPLDWRKMAPLEPCAASDRLGWVGLEAARYRATPAFEVDVPALTHHKLVLCTRPPEELDLRYEGVKRQVPAPSGAIFVVPAGSPHWVRSSGWKDQLHISLETGLVTRVAAEAFDLDPARLTVPPLDGLELPHLRAAMAAVGAELASDGLGGPLAAESLANVLAVHLIRHILAPRQPAHRRAGTLPEQGSAPSSSTSRSTSTVARPWSSWPRSPASAPTTSSGSSRGPPDCRRTSTSSPAASSGPGSSCKPEETSPWRRSPRTPASPTRASSPITSSARSASRRGSSAGVIPDARKNRQNGVSSAKKTALPPPYHSS
jgi:hypothetical protein